MQGVEVRELSIFNDNRGWLGEIIRDDESSIKPLMSYLSMTKPGMLRGPHEHKIQTDYFCFIGKFRIYIWDNRKRSRTYLEHKVIDTTEMPTVAIIPPGVVHAYKNAGDIEGFVINFPDRLYKGWKKSEPVDEVRYEDDPASPFRIED